MSVAASSRSLYFSSPAAAPVWESYQRQVVMRILLVDDHKIVSDGLVGLLERHPPLKVVGRAHDGRQAVELARELKPDVVIIDIAMPELNGIEATRRIVHESPDIKVIGLSMHADRAFVREMLRAGAKAYLLKESAFDEVITALRAVAGGQAFFSPAVAKIVMGEFLDKVHRPQRGGFEALTPREREVLQMLAEGKSTRQIAKELFVSVKTVEGYRRLIAQKTGARGIAEMTRYAIREGLTSL